MEVMDLGIGKKGRWRGMIVARTWAMVVCILMKNERIQKLTKGMRQKIGRAQIIAAAIMVIATI